MGKDGWSAIKTLIYALAIAFMTVALALAGFERKSGTVVAVTKEVVVIKGDDGKTFEVQATDVIGENLRTTDRVDYDVVDGKVQNIKRDEGY